MKKSVFDKIELSVFDTTELSVFDDVEPEIEDKILNSKELIDLVQEEIRKEVQKIPVGKIIAKILSKSNEIKNKELSSLKEKMGKDLDLVKKETDKNLTEVKELIEKFKKSFDDLKTSVINQPMYQFGGFSPQVNDLNIGDPLTDGSWRIVVSGNDLSVQRRESGSWVEKGSFQP